MNFKTPERVGSCIENLKMGELKRAPNRALIDQLFNGFPPYSSKEEEDNNIQVNVNFNEGAQLLLQAREQYENAFLSTTNFFTVKLPDAPKSKRDLYGGIITRELTQVMKHSKQAFAYLHTQRSKFGSVVLHGPGPQMWEDQWKWLPFFVGIEDLLIPTDTELTLENLTYFAVRRRMTPGDLYRKTLGKGKNVDPGWNLDAVKKILDSYKDLNQNQNTWNWAQHPERMQELIKQNVIMYDYDSVPKVGLWDFYYQDDETAKWHRVMMLDSDCANSGSRNNETDPNKFVYVRKEPFADSLDQILHLQFGDGNNKPPFVYHSQRSLGWMLFDVVSLMNRVRCEVTRKIFEDMMLMIRVLDPADRSKLDQIDIGPNRMILPDGMQFVTNEQRYKPDMASVQGYMANLKQLMGEFSSSYTQDIDTGTSKERTAFEVQALLSQTAKLTGSMLNLAYIQEAFAYKEICRRLTLKNSPDFTTKKFLNRCKEQGVPDKWMDSTRWEIEPERVIGNGNPQMAFAEAQALMNTRPLYNPQAQDKILYLYTAAVTRNHKLAYELAPPDGGGPKVTDSTHDTELAFAALMSGVPITPNPGLNPIEVTETMLRLMSQEIQKINASGGMGTPEQVDGLLLSAQYTQHFINLLAQDDSEKQRTKQYGDVLGQLMNQVKAFAQRITQAAAQQNGNGGGGIDPETQAAMQGKMMESQQKMMITNAKDQQKMNQKNKAFEAEEQRKNAATLAEIQRKSMLATADAMNRPEPTGGEE